LNTSKAHLFVLPIYLFIKREELQHYTSRLTIDYFVELNGRQQS
jgi:hypothetical protein